MKDRDKSFHWFLLAANQGLAAAQYYVGHAYYDGGRGVEKDIDQAFLWWQKSADLGCQEAQYNLGKHVRRNMYVYIWE